MDRTQSTWERTCSHVMRQPGCKPGRKKEMSPLAQLDQQLENIIRELTLRLVSPRWTEFDAVWEATNRICDRYGIKAPSQSR